MAVLLEQQPTGKVNNQGLETWGFNWTGFLFTASAAESLEQVRTWCQRVAGGNSLTCAIRATSGSVPTGSNLATSDLQGAFDNAPAGEFRTFTFATPLDLTLGVKYAAIFIPTGGDASNHTRVFYATGNPYAGGNYVDSTNSGSSWTATFSGTADGIFEIWGTLAPTGPKHLYLGGNAFAKRLIPMRGW